MKNSAFCFGPTETIDLRNMRRSRVAKKLTHDCRDEIGRAMGPCRSVRDGIQYNLYMVSVALEDPRAGAVLAGGKGCCV